MSILVTVFDTEKHYSVNIEPGDIRATGGLEWVANAILDVVAAQAIQRPDDGLPGVLLSALYGRSSVLRAYEIAEALRRFGVSSRVDVIRDW